MFFSQVVMFRYYTLNVNPMVLQLCSGLYVHCPAEWREHTKLGGDMRTFIIDKECIYLKISYGNQDWAVLSTCFYCVQSSEKVMINHKNILIFIPQNFCMHQVHIFPAHLTGGSRKWNIFRKKKKGRHWSLCTKNSWSSLRTLGSQLEKNKTLPAAI